MRRGLSSLLAAWVVTAWLGLAVEPTAALAAGSRSRAERPSARIAHSSRSLRIGLSGRRRTGVGPAVPGEGYDSPGGSAPVRALQRLLVGRGDRPGPIDGRYGALTEQAVRRFQAAHGLRVDGIAGPRTLAALTARTLVLYPGAGSEPGGSGPVRVLQRRLARVGYAPGPIDGTYGPLTERAVQRFQIAEGLPVDGIAGPQTFAHLARKTHPRHLVSHRSVRHRSVRHRSVRHRSRPHAARRPAPAIAPTKRARHATGSGSTGWLVLIGVLGLGLLMMAMWHARRRRSRLPRSLPIPGASAIAGRGDDRAAFDNQQAAAEVNGSARQAEQGAEVNGSARQAEQDAEVNGAFNLGVLLEEQGDLEGALRAYRAAEDRGTPEVSSIARAAVGDLRAGIAGPGAAAKGADDNVG